MQALVQALDVTLQRHQFAAHWRADMEPLPGYVTRIDLIDSSAAAHTIWNGTDPTTSSDGTPVDFTLRFPQTSYSVASATVYVDPSLGDGSIDAVRLLTGSGPETATYKRGLQVSEQYVFTLPGTTSTQPDDFYLSFGGKTFTDPTSVDSIWQDLFDGRIID